MSDTNPPGGQTGNPSIAVQAAINLLNQAHAQLNGVSHPLWGHREPVLEGIASASGRLQEALKQFRQETATT